jgi:hypothetical protein
MAGALTIRTFATISPTSHYGQRGRISLKISGKRRQSLSQLIEDQENKVISSTPHHLYHTRKPKRWFGTHTQIDARCARRLGLLATQTVQCLAHCKWGPSPRANSVKSTRRDEIAGKASHHAHNLKEECVPPFTDEVTPTSQQHNTTPWGGGGHKPDKEF